MNKKETLSLGVFLVSFLLIGLILFTGMNSEVTIKLENGKTISSEIPSSFPITSTLMLMLFSATGAVSLFYFLTDLSKKITLTNKQGHTLSMLEGDLKKVYLFIAEKGEILQKDLVYELGMPKARVTRILDKLADKDLVQRISYGKTNKITLK